MRKGTTKERRSKKWRRTRRYLLRILPSRIHSGITSFNMEGDQLVYMYQSKLPMTFLKLDITI